MTTAAVSYTVPSPAWTGSVDVTNANLDSDLTIKDFKVFYNDVEQGQAQLDLWSKVSRTSLSYSGAALTTNDVVRIQRDTPTSVIATVSPLDTIASSLWNAELDRISKRAEEYELFGLPTGTVSVSDEAYGSGWDSVTTVAPSKNSVYDRIQIVEPIFHMGGRLSTSSTLPYVTTNTTSSTIYYLPATSNVVYLYDGSRWLPHTFTSVTLAVGTVTDNLPYDLFLYSNAGTLTLERVAWSNYNTRVTALTRQNGVLVKTGELTKRYVGTFSAVSNTVYQGNVTTSATTVQYSTLTNEYNKNTVILETTGSITYDTGSSYDPWTSGLVFHVMCGNNNTVTLTIAVDHSIITGTTLCGYYIQETNGSNLYCRHINNTPSGSRTPIHATETVYFSNRKCAFRPEYFTSATANMSTQNNTLFRVTMDM